MGVTEKLPRKPVAALCFLSVVPPPLAIPECPASSRGEALHPWSPRPSHRLSLRRPILSVPGQQHQVAGALCPPSRTRPPCRSVCPQLDVLVCGQSAFFDPSVSCWTFGWFLVLRVRLL